MYHIKNTLPDIKAKVSAGLQKYLLELSQLGDPLGDEMNSQSNIVLNIITEFCNEYRTVLDGTSNEISSDELSGGARISFVFHEIYGSAIRSMDPFDQIKDVDIRTILYNSSVFFILSRVPRLPCLSAQPPLKSWSSSRSSVSKTLV